MSLSKDRRQQWREECEATKVVWSDDPDAAEIVIHADELRALLDMADERDLFRELLEAVWRAWPRNITAATLNRIKAALEGKHD